VRWKGIIFLVVLAVLVFVLNLVFTDRWLEKQLESAGSAAVGAKVELERLDFSLLGLQMRWDSLQVANPKNTMKNILTSGKTDFNFALLPLFQKKVVVENIKMKNVTSGTDRTTDGKIVKKTKVKKETKPNIITKTIDRLQAQAAEAPVWNLAEYGKKVNVDSILKILDLSSPKKIDSLQTQLTARYAYWDSTFAAVKWKQDLTFLESRIAALKPDEIKTIDGLQTALSSVQQMRNKVDSLAGFIKSTKSTLTADVDYSVTTLGLVDDWVKDDFRRALEKAKLPEFSKENMARFLFGGEVVNRTTQALAAVNTIRTTAQKFKSDKPPKEEKPPRMKGQTIYFVTPQRYPNFWIKNIELSGHTTAGLSIGGMLKNVVSQQTIIGQPTSFVVEAKRKDGANVELLGEFNYLSEQPREHFTLTMGKMPLQNVSLSHSTLLPQKIQTGSGNVRVTLDLSGNSVHGDMDFAAENLSFAYATPTAEKKIDELLRHLLQSAAMIDLQVSLASSEDRTHFSLNSNLDDLFIRELKAMAGQEIVKARARIESYVGEQVTHYKQQFEALVKSKTQMMQQEMAGYENLLNSQKQLVDEKQKQLQSRIEEEKQKGTKQVEDEVKKRLKGLGK